MVGALSCKCVLRSRLSKLLIPALAFCTFSGHTTAAAGPVTPNPSSERTTAAIRQVEFTPETVTFQSVPLGDTYTQTVKITNLSENTVQIKKIASSHANFKVTGILLPVVVAHCTSETFTISYRPTAEEGSDGRILIFTSSDDAPVTLNVRGSAVKVHAELTASEAAVDFEDVAVGGVAKHEIALTNSGTRDLSILDMSAIGAAFTVSGTTAVRLTPGQSINVEVKFAPKSAGRQSGQLTISDTDGSYLVQLPLAGTAAQSSRSAVRLSWEENPATAAGYVVYRSAESSGPYTRISEAPTSEFVDTGLAAGHTYYYVVTSLDADQVESEYSSPISATVPEA